jgi:hypothetical protein
MLVVSVFLPFLWNPQQLLLLFLLRVSWLPSTLSFRVPYHDHHHHHHYHHVSSPTQQQRLPVIHHRHDFSITARRQSFSSSSVSFSTSSSSSGSRRYPPFICHVWQRRQQRCTLRMAAQVNHLHEEDDNDDNNDDTENRDDPQLAVVHGSKNKAANTTSTTTTTTKDTTDKNNSSLTILSNIERILVLSDLHTDHVDNFKWLQQHTTNTNTVTTTTTIFQQHHHQQQQHEQPNTETTTTARIQLCSTDLIVVAGDISHELDTLEASLRLLSSQGSQVLFVPGNHEAWLTPMPSSSSSSLSSSSSSTENQHQHDKTQQQQQHSFSSSFTSLDKLNQVYQTCHRLGVLTGCTLVRGSSSSSLSLSSSSPCCYIVPLSSWYDATLTIPECEELCHDFGSWPWVDFIKCHWPVDRFPVRQTPRTSKRIPMGLTEYFAQHNRDTVLSVLQESLQRHDYEYHGNNNNNNNNANNNTNTNYNTTSTGSDNLGSVHDLSTPVLSSSSPLSSVNVTIMTVSHFLPNSQSLPDWKDLTVDRFLPLEWLGHGAGQMSAKFAKVAGTRLLDQQIRNEIGSTSTSTSASSMIMRAERPTTTSTNITNTNTNTTTTTSATSTSASATTTTTGKPPSPPPPSPTFRQIHVFGHSHRPKDFEFQGIRYIHNPLGKPRERDMYMINPNVDFQVVWKQQGGSGSGSSGGEVIPQQSIVRYWEEQGGGVEALRRRMEDSKIKRKRDNQQRPCPSKEEDTIQSVS